MLIMLKSCQQHANQASKHANHAKIMLPTCQHNASNIYQASKHANQASKHANHAKIMLATC